VDATVKAGLLALVAHAQAEGGWSLRKAANTLGLDHVRVLRWLDRAAQDRLVDAKPGPDVPLHALLDSERAAIVKLAEEWGEIDRSHRKLAHRGSRLDWVYASESTVLRVLLAEGVHLLGSGARSARSRSGPSWCPGSSSSTTSPTSPGCAAGARSRSSTWSPASGWRPWCRRRRPPPRSRWPSPARWSKTARNTCSMRRLLDELAHGVVPDDERVPVLLAVSDNGPQMTSNATAVFMAGARIAQHFGRPGTPNDQAWIESFFGHLKGEFPHLDKITDAGDLEAELDRLRVFWNGTRLHEGIGYVTPNDEHEGRGEAIRAARRAGLRAAHDTRAR